MMYIVSIVLTVIINIAPIGRIPDSLEGVGYNLNALVREANELKANINSQDDYLAHKYDIEYLNGDLDKLRNDTPEMSDVPELKTLYKECKSILDEIEKKVEDYRRQQVIDSLDVIFDSFVTRLDSILTKGKSYEERKMGDSVKVVKSHVDSDVWPELQQVRVQYALYISASESLSGKLKNMEQVRDEVKQLSEKNKPKVGDILLKLLVVAGVLTVVGGVVGGKIQSRKLQKKAAEAMRKKEPEDEVFEL